MNLRQQIIEDRIEEASRILVLDADAAFLRLAHAIVTARSIHAFDPGDLVDGGQDKQIDTITIEQDTDEATIFILQVKNTPSFSSNALIQMRNGLEWVFRKSRSDLNALTNVALRDRILEYRSVQSGLGPSNIRVFVAFITNGLTAQLSEEFEQEGETIRQQYDNGTFAQFRFEAIGADELVSRINMLEKSNRKIDVNIPIRYDANNPSLIKYHAEGVKGIVCTAAAREIAKIVNDDASGAVFDANIRRFLGARGAVNADIRRTCTLRETSYLFWFLNNGVTIVCDSADPVTDPDNAHVKVKNIQIVNGCQTATTLAMAERDGLLAADARVLLRIYETQDAQLLDKIVLTTNNQNKISSRDLRANDQVQVDMERAFAGYALLYERKVRQYDRQPGVDVSQIVPNETVAQSYLAIVLKMPSDARTRKYKVWGELYDRIFSGQAPAGHVLAVAIYRVVASWTQGSPLAKDANEIRRKVVKNGAFHIARVVAYLWRGTDSFGGPAEVLDEQIERLRSDPQVVQRLIPEAVHFIEGLINANPQFSADVDAALKVSTLDANITSALHRRGQTTEG